jgi:hypothetical protein
MEREWCGLPQDSSGHFLLCFYALVQSETKRILYPLRNPGLPSRATGQQGKAMRVLPWSIG